jgi:hypothetical protein
MFEVTHMHGTERFKRLDRLQDAVGNLSFDELEAIYIGETVEVDTFLGKAKVRQVKK